MVAKGWCLAEPRFVKPLRIGNYDRNLVNEPARGSHNGRPCTRNTRFVREEHSLGSVCSSISNSARECSKYPGHAFEPDNSIVYNQRNESCVNSAVILRTRNRGGLRAILFSGISHFADQFFQAKRIRSFLFPPIESNRDQFPARSVIRIHDLFRVVLFSPLFQPQVSSSAIKLDVGSNKKRAKVCLERVSKGGRSLSAISPWREFLTRGRWQQATGSRKNIHSAGQIIRWLVKRPLSFTD